MTLVFVEGQASYMRERGISVHAVSSPGELLDRFGRVEQIPVHGIGMGRRITPLTDLAALVKLVRLFRRVRPTIVHTHTLKAGLLGMLAAWFARVPIRVYHLHGLMYPSKSGFSRSLARWTEMYIARLAHRVICVGRSVMARACADGGFDPDTTTVLVEGSANGLDALTRFNPDLVSERDRTDVRAALACPEKALLVGFVGRIARDKGIEELVAAWRSLRTEYPELHLIMVGPFEQETPVASETVELIESDPRIYRLGWIHDMPRIYAALDLVVLPSYREGFPYVPLEAAAMGLPVVATRVGGCEDVVVDGKTGTLIPPRDATALEEALRAYLRDPDLRRTHGAAGRARVVEDFRREPIWEALFDEYCNLMAEKGIIQPDGGTQ